MPLFSIQTTKHMNANQAPEWMLPLVQAVITFIFADRSVIGVRNKLDTSIEFEGKMLITRPLLDQAPLIVNHIFLLVPVQKLGSRLWQTAAF